MQQEKRDRKLLLISTIASTDKIEMFVLRSKEEKAGKGKKEKIRLKTARED